MKLLVIYFDKLQWTEEQLKFYSKEKNIEIDFIESKEVSNIDFSKYDFVFNRVYASVANENDFDFKEFNNIMKDIESRFNNFINSSLASACDYDKYLSSKVMREKGILNPLTEKVSNLNQIKNFYLKNGHSIIFKPNTGGRGVNVIKIDSLKQIKEGLFDKNFTKTKDYIVQEMAEAVEPIDYRIFVYCDKILFGNTRTLVDGWLGSRSKGSKIKILENYPKELEEIAVGATKAIGARINSLDIVKTKKGYSIIENNLTPNFNQSYVEMFGFNPVEKILDQMKRDKK